MDRRAIWRWIALTTSLLIVCGGVFALIITGHTRRIQEPQVQHVPEVPVITTEPLLVPRHLDGLPVSPEEAARAPWAFMIDHQVDARPPFGVAFASLVIESPVEGGITRLMALFAPTSTLHQIGPIRSARPYFVDWAEGWRAVYAHVGGSPEALTRIATLGDRFHDANEMANGAAFWRDATQVAPHNAMTNGEQMQTLADHKGFASSTLSVVWHFLENGATSTMLGGVARISIPYGGSYNVVWKLDKESGLYVRSVAGRKAVDHDGTSIQSTNVVVIKTDARILDEKGRLRLRTTGSGDAIAYRDGNKFVLRWRRTPGEPMRFETVDGNEYLFRSGKTWIEVTTDDITFAGLEKRS